VSAQKLSPWKVLESSKVIDKRWLEVEEQRVELGSGHVIDCFHLIKAPSWTAVLCVTEDDDVVLVRQYRHGIAGESLELPAGVIEPSEPLLDCAKRELLEETGYAAERWVKLVSFSTEPSRHTTRAHFFCATGARRVAELSLDESEQVEVVLVPKRELLPLIERGEIVHGIHVGAILLAARRGLI
jgi:8-oxo-dGTP pyrophosphatase MutT (NUDIX family)